MYNIPLTTNKENPIGYVAGGLFSSSEIRQRLYEGKELRENTNLNWYNPIEAPINDKSKLPSAESIFNGDTQKVLESTKMLADLSDKDLGVAMELGIAWMANYMHHLAERGLKLEDMLELIPKKQVFATLPDIRWATNHCYKGWYVPEGYNQFVIGGVEQIGKIYNNFEDALEDLKK